MRFTSAATGNTLPSDAAQPKGDPIERAAFERSFFNQCGAIQRSRIPAFLTPYWNQESFVEAVEKTIQPRLTQQELIETGNPILKAVVDGEVYGLDPASVRNQTEDEESPQQEADSQKLRYSSLSIFSEVERFTSDVIDRFAAADFDIIHAHDWMTFPAGVALAKATKRPLIVHVHSLEHDRSGVFYDHSINAIENFGLQSADKIIAVSHYTKSSIQRYHKISARKIAVVHNGTYPKHIVSEYRQAKTWPKHVVLFLGRVTFQKGPDYFVDVAKKVIPHIDNVLFVLAGDGDLLPAVREKVAQLHLNDSFLFPGFVQGEELEELFSIADLYVMPSVSEPFGITALEAISYDTPVLLSKQSGVSEVVQHALKVDFWDTDRMADLIINALTHQELRQELVEKAREEVAHLHWGAAALKIIDVYQEIFPGSDSRAGVN
jgi:glycosyltransferase involved in cell wall biosynthesis